jgi:osmotically-inducible protein OsmY
MYRMISFVKGAAIGAGLMYYFDPVAGNRRRALLRDQLNHMLNKSCDVADAKWRDLQNRAYGAYAETRRSIQSDEPSDQVLVDRVRATIGRHVTHAGAIEVEACDGIVCLSGPALAAEVDELLGAVRSVRGVKDVEDQLDVHESAANISTLQGSGRQV